MAVQFPWSAPASTNVTALADPPWSAPGYIAIQDSNGVTPPWSVPGVITLRAGVPPQLIPLIQVDGTALDQPTTPPMVLGQAFWPGVWPIYTVNDLFNEALFEVAHRGYGGYRPEMTIVAYRNAARLGAKVMEVSVSRSADGYWVCSHDENTLRMTGADHEIYATNWVGVMDQLLVKWTETDTPTVTAPVHLTLLDQVAKEFGRTHVLWIQPKRDNDGQALVTWLNESPYIDNQHAMLKLFRGQYPIATYGREHGNWKSWGIWYPNHRMAWMEYFDMLGEQYDALPETWTGLLATDKRVIGHIINDASQRDQSLSKGATGWISMRQVGGGTLAGPPGQVILYEAFDNFTLAPWAVTGTANITTSGRTLQAMTITGAANYVTYSVPTAAQESDTLTVGFAFRINSLSTVVPFLQLRSDAGATLHTTINVTTTGAIEFRRGDHLTGTVLQSSVAGKIVTDTWQYVEVMCKLHDTNGIAIVRVNGQIAVDLVVTTVLPLDTRNGGTKTKFDRVRLVAQDGVTSLFDDLYVGIEGLRFKNSINVPTPPPPTSGGLGRSFLGTSPLGH